MKLTLSIYFLFFFFIFSFAASGSEPDIMRLIEISSTHGSELPSGWENILPGKQRAYTNYSIEKDSKGPYLRALSSATKSWLELELSDLDVREYSTMEWLWKVNQFPETEWEMDKKDDDFAVRIELVYDFKGGKKNIINIIRKGLITTIFKRYPPELIISYVWSLNVPTEKAYRSPNSKFTMVFPIESGQAMQGRWVREKRNIRKDLFSIKGEKTHLVLKKIRIRSDTDNVPSIAESGIKYIHLIPENSEDTR